MRLVVIGHQDAVMGLALVGVQGFVADSADACNKALDRILTDRSIGIVLITEDVASLNSERINALKRPTTDGPLVVEIPGPGRDQSGRSDLAKIIKQNTGVQV